MKFWEFLQNEQARLHASGSHGLSGHRRRTIQGCRCEFAKAILETAEIKKAQVDLEAKFKPRQDAMARLTKELQDIQTQLQSGKLNQNGEQS